MVLSESTESFKVQSHEHGPRSGGIVTVIFLLHDRCMGTKNIDLGKLEFYVKSTSFFRVPLLFFCSPKILILDEISKVQIPLNWVTKNHYRTMYFGALCMGAELCVALPLLEQMFLQKRKVNFIFKDFKADFLKRADTDVVFEFTDVKGLLNLVDTCESEKTRKTQTFQGRAHSASNSEMVFMTFDIAISVKPLNS